MSAELLEDRLAPTISPALPDAIPLLQNVAPEAASQNALDLRRVFSELATSRAYWEKAGATARGYRATLAEELLGGEALPAALRGLPLRTRAQRREFLNRLMQSDRFAEVWVRRLARAALGQGSFTSGQLREALRLLRRPGGFPRAIAYLLNTPQVQAELQQRATPPTPTPAPSPRPAARSFAVGEAFGNPYAVNRQSLVPDPVTDPIAWKAGAAPAVLLSSSSTQAVPMDSPWGSAVVLPEVPYGTIMAGIAVQPSLALPDNLVSASDLSGGITFQTWFQAKSPGALLTAQLTDPTTSEDYQAPLVYIDFNGKLVAGLFDPTPLAVQQINGENPTILSWLDAAGAKRIAAANPLVSQTSVVDNTWHHVDFVASSQGQALYLDGLLQGTSKPLNRDTYTPPTGAATTTVTVPLNGTPEDGGLLSGSIWEAGNQACTFSGWVQNGEAALTLTQTYNAVDYNGTYSNAALPYAATGVVYNAGSSPSLTITFATAATPSEVTVNVSYPTAGGVYALAPVSPALQFTGALTVGGTIVPEAGSTPYPEYHYPQGFIGTLDEVALWTTPLTQAQVQAAMTAPVSGDNLNTDLVAYFNFDQAPTNQAWSNQAPSGAGVAQGPTQGTLSAMVTTTIPTNPFTGVPALPGARSWGIGVMMPLSSPSLTLAPSAQTAYAVALAAGDQLLISLPDSPEGTLTVTITSDTEATVADGELLSPGSTIALVAQRTGSYELQLGWTSSENGNASVNFEHLPGPLNSLAALLTSYQDSVSSSETNTYFAYADSALALPNAFADASASPAAAPYWPLWSDASYFPVPTALAAHPELRADALRHAYQKLVDGIPQGAGLPDFTNVIGAAVTLPMGDAGTNSIQQILEQAYTAATDGGTPPTPPTSGPFPLGADTALDAVYEFLYNANLLRQNFYEVLYGGSMNPDSLVGWVQEVINAIGGQDAVPVTIANTISSGQTKQVQNITTTTPNPALQSTKQVVEGAVEWALGGVLGALLGIPGLGGAIVGAALGGAGASIANSYSNMAGASSTLSITVPVTPITNNQLTYGTLNDLATSLTATMIQQWNGILAAVNDPKYAQAVMSNFGLLEALSSFSSAPLGNTAASASTALTSTLGNASWRTMIPAAFTWQPVEPYNFLSGDGRTTNLTAQALALNGPNDPLGITSGDFNGDGFLDLATANFESSNVSVLLSNGNSSNGTPSFATAVTYSLGGPNGALGIVSADFNKDGYADLAVANQSSSDVSILLSQGSDGTFGTATTLPLNGPDEAHGITSGDFNGDGNPDLAVSNAYGHDSDNVSVLLGDGTGGFGTPATYGIGGPDGPEGIVSGDFNNDGFDDLATANNGSGSVSVLMSNGSDGTFAAAVVINLDGFSGAVGLAVGNFNDDGWLDLAVADTFSVIVLTGQGDGSFTNSDSYSSVPALGAIAARDWDNDGYDDIVAANGTSGVSVMLNEGNGQFFSPIVYATDYVAGSITTGDYNGDGFADIGLGYTDSYVGVLSGVTVGTFATFLPDSAVEVTPIGTLLSQVQTLQGGKSVRVGPYDSTSFITPWTSTPPNYLAYVGLPYLPDAGPLSVAAPGWFLSVTPVTMSQSASDYSYTQSGNVVTGWNLLDSNGNPIAAATLQQLFGTPVPQPVGSSPRLTGVDLDPIDPQQPFLGLNGGWYFGARPVAGAATTWAEAFFVWGLGTSGYSQRVLVPTYASETQMGLLTGTLSGTSSTFPSDFEFTLTFQPATDAPPE